MWFNASVVTTSYHQPTHLSKILYVELLNSKGKVLETKKLKVEDGRCYGDFYLSTLNVEYFPGFYEVRAYTKNMLNFGEEVIFSRVFPVFAEYKPDNNYNKNDLKEDLDIYLPTSRKKASKSDKVNVKFYPEGGNLVNGLSSTVAFKAVGEDGAPIHVKGEVINSRGEIVSAFSDLHAGMGSFAYTPDGSKNKVQVTFDQKKYSFDLPAALSSGCVMTVNNNLKNSLIVQIEKTEKFPPAVLGLSILCRGEVVYFQDVELNSSVFQLRIPKEDLPSGVNQIVLFNQKGEIYSERLAFIPLKTNEKILVEVAPDKEEYQPLERVNVNLSVPEEHISSEIHFSLSIRDAETIAGTTHKEDIASYFLLSSDLQGYIEDPVYYFENQEPARVAALDLLMLVQGWKRYEWQSMAGLKTFKFDFEPEKQLTIKGFISDPAGKNVEVKARLQNEDNTEFMDESTFTDEKGYFHFYPEDYYGEWFIAIRSPAINDARKKIRLDRWFSPSPKPYFVSELDWDHVPGKLSGQKDLTPKELMSANDSLARLLLLSEVEIKENREKDLIYHVGREIDRMIDKGESTPEFVHDYLSLNDENYKGVLYAVAARYNVENDNLIDLNTSTDPTFSSDITSLTESQRSIGGNDPNAVSSTEFSSLSYLPVAPNFKEHFTAQEMRNNIEIKNISDIETNGVFFYKEPFHAVFFHMDDNKWNIYFEKPLRVGKRNYDIVLQQFTSRRKIEEVNQIMISQKTKSDKIGNPYIPIYIYPYRNFQLRVIPGTRYTGFDGYSKPKEFFSSYEYRDDSLPDTYDHKRTLYWNPDVIIDKTGQTTISFYNNLSCRKLDISLEGITQQGIPILKQ
ncbi:MAG: hypothetical protein LIO93_09780 [Bacteroidales bacterium]|nr:hypothetical protein [Bacteroidales bacterium]